MKRKVPETIAEKFGLAAELFLGESSTDNLVGRSGQTRRYCELKKVLCEVRKGAEKWISKAIELKKLQKEPKHIRSDALATLQNERKAARKLFKTTEKREMLTKAHMEATKLSERINVERAGALEWYCQVLFSI